MNDKEYIKSKLDSYAINNYNADSGWNKLQKIRKRRPIKILIWKYVAAASIIFCILFSWFIVKEHGEIGNKNINQKNSASAKLPSLGANKKIVSKAANSSSTIVSSKKLNLKAKNYSSKGFVQNNSTITTSVNRTYKSDATKQQIFLPKNEKTEYSEPNIMDRATIQNKQEIADNPFENIIFPAMLHLENDGRLVAYLTRGTSLKADFKKIMISFFRSYDLMKNGIDETVANKITYYYNGDSVNALTLAPRKNNTAIQHTSTGNSSYTKNKTHMINIVINNSGTNERKASFEFYINEVEHLRKYTTSDSINEFVLKLSTHKRYYNVPPQRIND